jgi:hypothetical protein
MRHYPRERVSGEGRLGFSGPKAAARLAKNCSKLVSPPRTGAEGGRIDARGVTEKRPRRVG